MRLWTGHGAHSVFRGAGGLQLGQTAVSAPERVGSMVCSLQIGGVKADGIVAEDKVLFF